MPRKKTAAAEATETPDVFDQAIAEQQTPTTLGEVATSYAEKFKREPGYSAAGKQDVLAGVRLMEFQDAASRTYMSVIRFTEKPSEDVITKLKDARFRWNSERKEWARPVEYQTRIQDRVDAERVFEDVCKTVRAERGIEHGHGFSVG